MSNENSMPMDDEDGKEWFAFDTTIKWCHGTIVQGNRILNLKFPELPHAGDCPCRKKLDEYQTIRMIDEHFFLIAARQVIKWCERIKKKYPELALHLNNFCPNIKDVRDMREHADEYLLDGKGRKQSNYIVEIDHADCAIPGTSKGIYDASATGIFGDQYLIGGRVDVRETVKQVDDLLCILIPFMHKKWTWTNPLPNGYAVPKG